LFVGGGPIPFTAIIFADKYDFSITVIDKDREAVKISRKLLRELDIDGKVVQSDASEFDNYGDFGTIHVASMVGSTENEELKVFKNIKSQVTDHSHVIARTVHGNRRLLYRPVSDEVKAMFDILAESRPSADIINSTIIMARD